MSCKRIIERRRTMCPGWPPTRILTSSKRSVTNVAEGSKPEASQVRQRSAQEPTVDLVGRLPETA
jgi:hypothetical protein